MWSSPVPFQPELSEILVAVRNSTSANWQLSFAAITKAKQPAHFQHLAIRPETLGRKVKTVVLEVLQNLDDRIDDDALEIHEYSGATSLDDNEIEHISLIGNERILSQIAPLNAPADMARFDNTTEFNENLRFYVISLWPIDGLPIHCFRLYSDAYELNKRWFMIHRGADYFDTFEQTGFLFDDKIDCIMRGDDLFILKMDSFHRIFQFYEYVARDALEATSEIDSAIGLGNIEQLTDACSRDHIFAMKFAGLAGQPHLRKLTMKHLKRMIARHEFHIRVVVHEGREVLEYSSKYRWEFYHLLADDYLHSQMTSEDYRSSRKRLMAKANNPHLAAGKSKPKLLALPDVADESAEKHDTKIRRRRTSGPTPQN
jgi:hypothetical protein